MMLHLTFILIKLKTNVQKFSQDMSYKFCCIYATDFVAHATDIMACAISFVALATDFVAYTTDSEEHATDFVACGMLDTNPTPS